MVLHMYNIRNISHKTMKSNDEDYYTYTSRNTLEPELDLDRKIAADSTVVTQW